MAKRPALHQPRSPVAPQPLTTSERAELENYRNAHAVPGEAVSDDCPAFIKYDVTEVDEAWARGFNACRAAMLQGAENAESRCTIQTAPALYSSPKIAESRCSNAPVITDGWVACSERMPEQGDYVSAVSRHGEYVSGQVIDDWLELHDGTSFGVYELYLWMPLPAVPAAPKQEAE